MLRNVALWVLVRCFKPCQHMIMKWIDIPPVWLAACLAIAYQIGKFRLFDLSLAHPITQFLAAVLIGGGIILILLAASEMRRQGTTIIPHLQPEKLVQTGIFKRTRNPIYLGDLMILAGFILRWDAPAALPLVPILAWVLERRFILPEEDRLRRSFRADFARYCQNTGRWITR